MQGQVRHQPDSALALLRPPDHWSNWVVQSYQQQPLLYQLASRQPVQLDYGRRLDNGRWTVPDSGSNGNNPNVGARSWNPHNTPANQWALGVPVKYHGSVGQKPLHY